MVTGCNRLCRIILQFPIAGGAAVGVNGGTITGQYAGAIYVCSTIAMLTYNAHRGICLAICSTPLRDRYYDGVLGAISLDLHAAQSRPC